MRIKWLDSVKGLTILLVLVGHCLLGLYLTGRYPGADGVLKSALEFLYRFHMPVFFAASGYFFKPVDSFNSLGRIMYRKLVALGVPYVVFSVVMYLLQTLGEGDVRNKASIQQLLGIYKEPIGFLWFLYTLFFIYLLLGALSIYIKDKLPMTVILVIGYCLASIFPTDLLFIQRTLVWAPMFYVGYLFKGKEFKIDYKVWILVGLYVLHVPLFRWIHPEEPFVNQTNPQWWSLFSLIGIYLGFTLIPLIKGKAQEFLAYLGVNSMVIYLVHSPVLSVTRILLYRLKIDALALHVVIGSVIALIISVIAVYLANRFSLIRFWFYPLKPKS